MEKQRETRIVAVLALLIAVVGISIGFAAMSTTLQIQGTAEMNPSKWKIELANLSSPQLTGAASVEVAPTINNNGSTLSDFKIVLTKPGDKVVYTFDVRNTGDIDAVLATYTKATRLTCVGTGATATSDEDMVCENIVYTLVYTTGGTTVMENNPLDAGQTRNLTLTIEYPATMETVPVAKVDISGMTISFIYNQA